MATRCAGCRGRGGTRKLSRDPSRLTAPKKQNGRDEEEKKILKYEFH